MPDLGGVFTELESGDFGSELESGQFDFDEEYSSPFSETLERELAAQMLEVTDEGELERFLGKLIKKAGRAVGTLVSSPVGKALGGILKGAAKKALPVVGGALGNYFGDQVDAQVGNRLASGEGRIFGLELEGLSLETH